MKSFKQLLERLEPILLVGAHTGLGAKIAEESGFDGVWASGLEISASCGIPDANILSVSDNLGFAERINDACSIPVLCDCDNGYGNATNTSVMASKYEKHGLAGICIEDNTFPKQNSFYGKGLALEPIEVFCGKIRAAKKITDKDFFVVARTESFIQGKGIDEALERAHAYAEAGADAILIHSKKKTPDELFLFAKRWKRDTPLVAVPTTYNTTSADELYAAGYKIIIFANHGLRACITALRSTYQTLKKDPRGAAVDLNIATLEEVFELTDKKKFDELEEKFIPKTTVPAIVLAAGKSPDIDLPQALLEVRGMPILEHLKTSLHKSGINDIIVVRGYQKELFVAPGFTYIDNDAYEQTHILHSLLNAQNHFSNGFLCIHGDVLFDHELINNLLKRKEDIVLSIDRAGIDSSVKSDFVQTIQKYTERRSVRSFQFVGEDRVLNIGQKLNPTTADGEFTGLAYFSQRGAKALVLMAKDCAQLYESKPFHEATCFDKASLTDAIQELIDRGVPVHVSNTYKGWMDVDDHQMLTKAQKADFS